VAVVDPDTHEMSTNRSLLDLLGSDNGMALPRVKLSEQADRAERRALEQRIQRTLQDGLPVIFDWWVDENADQSGNFTLESLKARGHEATAGGHTPLIPDYQTPNVPGCGPLAAGTPEPRPEALAAALDPAATFQFFRVKNSWGTGSTKT